MASVNVALTGAPAWFDAEIRHRHGFLTFQMPDKVADAIRLISDVKLWAAVAPSFGTTDVAAKTQLKLIVERRNKIAHEADQDPTTPGQRWPIDELLVANAVDFLKRTVAAIHAVL